jgi:ubiquinone/menaquinone biosynthesis C-methylase UbiE
MPSKTRVLLSDPRAIPFLSKKIAKFFFDKAQWIEVKFLTAFGVIDFKVPPNSSMRESSSTNIRHYYESGLTTTLPIVTAAYIEGLDLRQPAEVLDFGCGVGRQLLQLARRYPKLNLHACDVNGRSIAYLKRAYPKIDSYANEFSPPLKFSDSKFDLILSVSIFSHLSIKDNPIWLKELARVTRPGGLCCLTILGSHAMGLHAPASSGPFASDQRKQLEEQGFLFQNYERPDFQRAAAELWDKGNTLQLIKEEYGNTYLSERFIRENWDNGDFELRQFIPGIIDQQQDLVVLKRR